MRDVGDSRSGRAPPREAGMVIEIRILSGQGGILEAFRYVGEGNQLRWVGTEAIEQDLAIAV